MELFESHIRSFKEKTKESARAWKPLATAIASTTHIESLILQEMNFHLIPVSADHPIITLSKAVYLEWIDWQRSNEKNENYLELIVTAITNGSDDLAHEITARLVSDIEQIAVKDIHLAREFLRRFEFNYSLYEQRGEHPAKIFWITIQNILPIILDIDPNTANRKPEISYSTPMEWP